MESACASCNGSTSKIVCSNAGQSQDANGFKYTFSITTSSDVTTAQRVIYQDKIASGSGAYASSILIFNGLIHFYFTTTAGDNVSTAIVTNTQYDVVCEYDGANIVLTLNGTPTSKVHGTGGAPFSTVANLIISGREDGTQAYNGCIWNVKAYDSLDIILASYPLQKSTYDISGNANHGTPTDITWGVQDNYHYNITKGFGHNDVFYEDFEDGVSGWYDSVYTLSQQAGGQGGSSYCGRLAGLGAGASNIYCRYDGLGVLGKTYRVSGYFRGDGNVLPIVTFGNGTATGTNSNTWQYFTFDVVHNGATSYILCTYTDATSNPAYYIEVDNITIQEIYIPRLADDSGYAATVSEEHPAKEGWHNGAETKWILGATTYDTGDSAWNVDAAVQAVDTEHILHSSSTNYGIAQSYDDMVAEQGEYLFMDVSTANQYKNVLLYNNKQTGTLSVGIHNFVGNRENLVVDANGEYVYEDDAPNDYPVWEE